MKKFNIFILSLLLMTETAFASKADDFEALVTQRLQEYQMTLDNFRESIKNTIIPETIKHKFSSTVIVVSSDLGSMNKKLTEIEKSILDLTESSNKLINKISQIKSKPKFDTQEFTQILNIQAQITNNRYVFNNKVESFSQYLSEIESNLLKIDNLIITEIKNYDINKLSLDPKIDIRNPKYISETIDTKEIEAAFLKISIPATILAATIISGNGMVILSTLTNLFLSGTVSMSMQLSTSAIPVVGAVVLCFVAAKMYADYKKRKKEQEDSERIKAANSALVEGINNIRNNFNEKLIKNSEYQNYALQAYQNEKNNENGIFKSLFEMITVVVSEKKDILIKLRDQFNQFVKTESDINFFVENYKSKMKEAISKAFLMNLEKSAVSYVKVGEAIRYYNENIFTVNSIGVEYFIENSDVLSECETLNDYNKRKMLALNLAKDKINSFKDSINEHNYEFVKINNKIDNMILYFKNINIDCMNIEKGTDYEIPIF